MRPCVAARAGTYVSVSASMWRNRDFVRYWVGHTVSQLGSEVTELALPLVALLRLGASSGEVGTIPVGAAIGGWLGGTIGLRATLAPCAAGALLTVGFPLFSAVRRLRHTPCGGATVGQCPQPRWSRGASLRRSNPTRGTGWTDPVVLVKVRESADAQ